MSQLQTVLLSANELEINKRENKLRANYKNKCGIKQNKYFSELCFFIVLVVVIIIVIDKTPRKTKQIKFLIAVFSLTFFNS